MSFLVHYIVVNDTPDLVSSPHNYVISSIHKDKMKVTAFYTIFRAYRCKKHIISVISFYLIGTLEKNMKTYTETEGDRIVTFTSSH